MDGERTGVINHAPTAVGVQPVRRGRWMTLLLGVVAGGLVLGAIAAAVSTPLRGTPRVVVTPLPLGAGAGGAAGRGAAAGAGGEAAEGTEGAGPGVGAQQRGASTGAAGGRQEPGGAGAGAAGARTNGVIASVDGDTMVVNTPDGPVRVSVGDATSVQKLAPAERTELTPGQRVVVSGERAGDGAVAASGVQILGDQAAGDGGPAPGARGSGGQGAGDRGQGAGARGPGGGQPGAAGARGPGAAGGAPSGGP
jgi:hypothetical protein